MGLAQKKKPPSMQKRVLGAAIRRVLKLGIGSPERSAKYSRELVAEKPTPIRDLGFGRKVRDALTRRRQWLIEQGFAREEQDRTLYRGNMLTQLQGRELKRAAGQLSGELGLAYTEAKSGTRIEGIYRRHVDLASGRFAVIEKSREFTLVPWRPVLERNLGRSVSGVMRGDAISWTLGRQRGGPTVG
jgi:hypothetical protein